MTRLTLLHTNDIHGRVSQLLRIAGLVKRIKREVVQNGGFCRYLDAGDAEDTVLLESSLTRGTAMDAILKASGVDHVALGNAIPIRYGQQVIPDLAEWLGKPLLCANLFDESGVLQAGLEPYRIEQIGPLKVAWIGFTAQLVYYAPFFHLDARDPVSLLPTLVREVREKGAQTVIVVAHIGSKKDRELAELNLDIDVIIGGHDHQVIYPPLEIKNTLIVQTGDYGRFLGRLDLDIDDSTGKVIQFKGELLPVTEELPEDPDALQAFHAQQARADEMMAIPVGVLEQPLELSSTCECSAGDFLADALLDRVKDAGIGLVLAGHWTCGLDAGTVTQGKLYAAMRSTGNPARVEMTGAEIERFLCKALRPHLDARQLIPLRGNPVGMPHVAGIQVVDGDVENGRLTILKDGQPLEPERTYIVATSDLEISDILDYFVVPLEKAQFEMPTILPEVLEQYIQAHSPVPAPQDGRLAAHLFKT